MFNATITSVQPFVGVICTFQFQTISAPAAFGSLQARLLSAPAVALTVKLPRLLGTGPKICVLSTLTNRRLRPSSVIRPCAGPTQKYPRARGAALYRYVCTKQRTGIQRDTAITDLQGSEL